MGIMNEIIDGQDAPGSMKDAGNALLSHFEFNITGMKGKKGPEFPLKKAGMHYKKVHQVRPREMAENELSREAVVVFPLGDDVNQGNTKIVEEVRYEYGETVETVPCEEEEGAKKAISDIDVDALPLEED